MLTWKEFRISREGRRGFLLSLPCFDDDGQPENAVRMNRFYEAAAEDLYGAALEAVGRDARRVYYRCLSEVEEGEDGVRVILRLSLSVSGERTRRKNVVHLWKDGAIASKEVSAIL